MEVLGERDVVVADDGDVVGDPQSGLGDGAQGAGRDHVVPGEDGRELRSFLEEFGHRAEPGGPAQPAVDDLGGLGREPVPGEGGAVAAHPGVQGGVAGQSAEEDDPAVAGREQVPGDGVRPRLVVELDDERGDVGVGGGPAAQHQAGSGGGEGLRVVRDALTVGVVLDDSADQDDQPGALLPHELHELQLALRVPAGGPDQAEPAVGGRLRLDAFGDLGVERAGDLAQDDGDRLAAAADEGPGVGVGDVVEGAGGAQHPGAGGLRNRVVAAEHPGDRGHGHARAFRHLTDGHPSLCRHVVPRSPRPCPLRRRRRLRCRRRTPRRTPRPFCRRPGSAISAPPRRTPTSGHGRRRRR